MCGGCGAGVVGAGNLVRFPPPPDVRISEADFEPSF